MRKFALSLESGFDFDFSKPFAFLGGTMGQSTWREELYKALPEPYHANLFNPKVSDWTPDDAKRETQAKAPAHALGSARTPHQKGFYGIAEMSAAVFNTNARVSIFLLFLDDDNGVVFEDHQRASVDQIRELYATNPFVRIFSTVSSLASALQLEFAQFHDQVEK